MRKHQNIHPYVPFWVGVVYGILTIITVPWTLYLAIHLPQRHLSTHWDIAWVGLDTALAIALAATAWLAIKKSRLLIMAATITATMLVVDAWFDVMTARTGRPFVKSIILAVFIELPLAFITYRLAYVILSKELKVIPGQSDTAKTNIE